MRFCNSKLFVLVLVGVVNCLFIATVHADQTFALSNAVRVVGAGVPGSEQVRSWDGPDSTDPDEFGWSQGFWERYADVTSAPPENAGHGNANQQSNTNFNSSPQNTKAVSGWFQAASWGHGAGASSMTADMTANGNFIAYVGYGGIVMHASTSTFSNAVAVVHVLVKDGSTTVYEGTRINENLEDGDPNDYEWATFNAVQGHTYNVTIQFETSSVDDGAAEVYGYAAFGFYQ